MNNPTFLPEHYILVSNLQCLLFINFITTSGNSTSPCTFFLVKASRQKGKRMQLIGSVHAHDNNVEQWTKCDYTIIKCTFQLRTSMNLFESDIFLYLYNVFITFGIRCVCPIVAKCIWIHSHFWADTIHMCVLRWTITKCAFQFSETNKKVCSHSTSNCRKLSVSCLFLICLFVYGAWTYN